MRNTIKTFLALIAFSLVFAGCTQNLDNAGGEADKITLNGSVGISGAVPSALFNAIYGNASGRTAVTSGSLAYGYSFGLSAENESTGEKVSAEFETGIGNETEFSITLEKARYRFNLYVMASNKNEYNLNVSKIEFGGNISSGNAIDLTDVVDLASAKIKVHFAPSTESGNVPDSANPTVIKPTGTGSVKLSIKSTCTEKNPAKVKYVYIRMPDVALEADDATIGIDSVNFENGIDSVNFEGGVGSANFRKGIATINNSSSLANGVYRFAFIIYDENEKLLATASQIVNVFAGFVTDTWLDNGSKFLVTEDGVTNFVVTDALALQTAE